VQANFIAIRRVRAAERADAFADGAAAAADLLYLPGSGSALTHSRRQRAAEHILVSRVKLQITS
jgi:hypothetical protein